MTEVKLYKTTLKGLKIFALTIPFVAIGIWMISNEPFGTTNYVMGWVCTCFFALGIPVGLFQALDKRPQIIINENGIWDRTTHQDQIMWEQIKGAYPFNIYRQKFVSLVVDDAFLIKKKQYKWASKLNEAIGAQKINLLISQLKIDEHRMTAFINEIIATEKDSRKVVIKKYFDIWYQPSPYGDIRQLKSIPQSPASLFLTRGFIWGLFGYFCMCCTLLYGHLLIMHLT